MATELELALLAMDVYEKNAPRARSSYIEAYPAFLK